MEICGFPVIPRRTLDEWGTPGTLGGGDARCWFALRAKVKRIPFGNDRKRSKDTDGVSNVY